MKIKITLEHTADPSEAVPAPVTTKFEMTGEADKDFPLDKISRGIEQVFSLITRGYVPPEIQGWRPEDFPNIRPDLSDLGE